MSGHPWPLFDLRLRTPRLELRLPTDDELLALMPVARAGILEEGQVFFAFAWHEVPSPAFEREFLQYWWRHRGTWRPSEWSLGLAVFLDGRPIGIQSIAGRDFAVRRTVATGSWLGKPYQGQGYGTEMRAAVLTLAFEGLGALCAESGYFPGNRASSGVSGKLGYVENGEEVVSVAGKRHVEQRLRLTPETWQRDLVPVTIEGLDPCLPLFGVGELSASDWASL